MKLRRFTRSPRLRLRWPISNPGAENFRFCGNEPVKGLPYCLGHARIAYRRPGSQRLGSTVHSNGGSVRT